MLLSVSAGSRRRSAALFAALGQLDLVPVDATAASLAAPQTFYLDFQGADHYRYDGPVTIAGINIPSFAAPAALAGQESTIETSLVASLNAEFAGTGVTFTDQLPAAGSGFSTVYIGGTGAEFASFGDFLGVAEKIDTANQDHNDAALVFSQKIGAGDTSVQAYTSDLATVVAHEAGHLLGFEHIAVDTSEDQGPLDDVAFKPYTHVETAKDIRDDLIVDGKLTINGHDYTVDPKLVEAITRYPTYYNAGAVGPDGFPDFVMGQSIVHPIDTGIWMQRILDMAWSAQSDPTYTPDEQLQILAFAYGYATHAAGDHFAHNLVNEFADGIYPSTTDVLNNTQDLANAVRHFIVEGYIGNATPGYDNDTLRSLLPDGDLSNSSTVASSFDVPTRFVYEALIKPFPGDPTAAADTGYTTLGVNSATNQFTRTSGSFLDDHFVVGQTIYAFGFGSNNGHFTVTAVSANSLTVAEPLSAGDETGSGDEALVTMGSRGVLLDTFFKLRDAVAEQANIAATAYITAYGTAPTSDFNGLLDHLIALGSTPSVQQTAELYASYLAYWRDSIDAGVQDWAQFGLDASEAVFDFQALRNVQNAQGQGVGNDADPERAAAEDQVGLMSTILAQFNDPNQDGDTSDSFFTNHLLPMLGVPQRVADLGNFLSDFITPLEDNIIEPLRLALNPLSSGSSSSGGGISAIPKQFVEQMFQQRYGLDVETIGQLINLPNGMDLETATIGSKTIDVFQPGDHAKLDSYLGIHSQPATDPIVSDNPNFVFFDRPQTVVGPDIEFDTTRFAAFADAVTLGKLILLQENPVDGDVASAGQLSTLVNNTLADLGTPLSTPYDWSLLNMNGNDGGNVLTTTLQKPGVMVEATLADGTTEQVLSDAQPWLLQIDGDHNWRQDSLIVSDLAYRVAPQATGTATASASWTIPVVAGQAYQLQASWMSNVTERINGQPINPATNAHYQVFDGVNPTPIADFFVNQHDLSNEVSDGTFAYNVLGSVTSASGTLRVVLDNVADGDVLAGPVRVQQVNDPLDVRQVQLLRDPQTLAAIR